MAFVETVGARTALCVPMLKDNDFVGVFCIFRREVRPFADKQIDLVKNFAAQAVIAIENTRLLSELRQRTDELGRSVGELRALGEVSQAVNSTLDLGTVLSTIVAEAVQLSSTDAGAIYVFDDVQREFHLRATYGMSQELIDVLTRRHVGLQESNIRLALAQREPAQIADLKEQAPSAVNDIIMRAGYRALLVAPLLRGEEIVGLLVVRRRTPGAFAQNTVALMKTFAAQSVLAIQNARLFQDVETQSGELAKSLADLRTAQDRLVQTEKLASLGQLTAGIAHEIKNPLNFVNNFSAVSTELIDELLEVMQGIQIDAKRRGEIDELAGMLRGNLDKVVQHGKRAEFDRQEHAAAFASGLWRASAGRYQRPGRGKSQSRLSWRAGRKARLQYHARAVLRPGRRRGGSVPAGDNAGAAQPDLQRLLRGDEARGRSEWGRLRAYACRSTKNLGQSVEIRIRDNGTGIPPEVKEKMFNPFFTTKPAGEGTGLGLSISHDIIVTQHGGSIQVDTQPGEFTEFRIVLPRGAATVAK